MDEFQIRGRGRGNTERRGTHRNKQWVAGHESGVHGGDGDRWERGGHRGGRGRSVRNRGTGSGRSTPFLSAPTPANEDATSGTEDEGQDEMHDMGDAEGNVGLNDADDPEERERFWKELVKARELEKKRMIAEKKWADPDAPMRLEDAITPVGTCTDMCPPFERYRREREHNLDKWEVIPGTKRVDHRRAVKMYERASGSKSLPSDLRTPETLRKTLDYLFHDLLPRGGFTETHSFIRDRSRAVRNDFTPQLITGPLAIECHDRCARFHIVAMHLQRDVPGFDLRLEEQQLSHALLSLNQFYEDQRGRYTSSTELEMRVYHRLISVRDLKERHEDIPVEITSHPVFQLTTKFRHHVQKQSAPISRTSQLHVGEEGMQIFGQLAAVLQEQNNVVVIYLIGCILERLFGKDTIEDMEGIRGQLSIPDIIDGVSIPRRASFSSQGAVAEDEVLTESVQEETYLEPLSSGASEWLAENFAPGFLVPNLPLSAPPTLNGVNNSFAPTREQPKSAFANIQAVPNAFGTGTFGPTAPTFSGSAFGAKPVSAFGGTPSPFSSTAPTSSKPEPIPSSSSATPSFGSSSIFSAETRNKPFGGHSATAFTTSTASSSPTPQPHAFNGFTPQPAQSLAHAPLVPSSTPPSLNPQAPTFVPSPPPSSFTPTPFAVPHVAPFSTTSQSNSHSHPQIFDSGPSSSAHTPQPYMAPAPSEEPISKPTTPQPRIIDRRLTLWEFPGSASPQKNQPRKSPTVEIPPPSIPGETTAPSTPTEPPPLNKALPLSLPPTPTARWFDPSSQQQAKLASSSSSSLLRKQSLVGFPALQMPSSPSTAQMLSPLQIPSVGSMKWPAVPAAPASPTPTGTPAQPSSSSLTLKPTPQPPSQSKGKAREVNVDLEELATEFSRRYSPLVKHFRKWMKRATDYAAWHEACRRSDAYREKIQHEKLSSSMNGVRVNGRDAKPNKRRASSGMNSEPSLNKRARRRVSTEYKAPLTDDELVQRLKENQEEHQKRWAQGSFLNTIRQRVERLSPDHQSHSAWRIWLSLNTENDGTAIWLEHKFDLSQSGEWISDTVFSMPAISKTPRRLPLGSPGLLVFERTPLEGVTDPIERKYRVLDDCARLRDIVEGLTTDAELRFIPSLLIINWSNSDEEETNDDLLDMARSFVKEGTLKSCHVFIVSSTDKDLDKTFEVVVNSLELEVEDRLLQTISWHDLAELFIGPFKSSASDWLHSCWPGDHFDWTRYGDVLRSIEEAQVQVVCEILGLLDRKAQVHIEMPVDTQAPAHLGIEYATGPFLDAFVKLATASAERLLNDDLQLSYTLPREHVSAASARFQGTLDSIATRLRELGASTLSKWTKRRAEEDISPTLTPKRIRPSLSRDASDADISITEDSPPPSTMATSTAGYTEIADKAPVTVAMLRALARDILKSR